MGLRQWLSFFIIHLQIIFFSSIILGNTLKSLANYQTDFRLLVRGMKRAPCAHCRFVLSNKKREISNSRHVVCEGLWLQEDSKKIIVPPKSKAICKSLITCKAESPRKLSKVKSLNTQQENITHSYLQQYLCMGKGKKRIKNKRWIFCSRAVLTETCLDILHGQETLKA